MMMMVMMGMMGMSNTTHFYLFHPHDPGMSARLTAFGMSAAVGGNASSRFDKCKDEVLGD